MAVINDSGKMGFTVPESVSKAAISVKDSPTVLVEEGCGMVRCIFSLLGRISCLLLRDCVKVC